MNKAISLPRIRKTSEPLKPVQIKSRKNSIQLLAEGLDSGRNKIENAESKVRIMNKNRSNSLKMFKRQSSNEAKPLQTIREKKFGLQQNGKISKVTEQSSIQKVLSTERSRSSGHERQDKENAAKIKKQLNEVSSSSLILKKQIKAMQGRILQLKQQISHFPVENPTHTDGVVQLKIQQIKKRTQVGRFDQEILKSMKDRLKKILIYYQKKTIEQRQVLQHQSKRNKILKQRSAFRQQSINKQKSEVKKLEQKQKTTNKLVELSVQDYQKRIKMLNEKNQIAQKLQNYKTLNEEQYHLDVYKKQQAELRSQLLANVFLEGALEIKWNKISTLYEKEEKAQKLIEMHSIDKNYDEFDPKKVYFGSFDNKKQLETKIKEKQNKLNQVININAQLKQKWKEFQFKQIEQQQNIIDSIEMDIKTGKIQQKQVINQQNRQNMTEMKKYLEVSKQRAAKLCRIKDWVIKMQTQLNIQAPKKSTIEDRLMKVIGQTGKQIKGSLGII